MMWLIDWLVRPLCSETYCLAHMVEASCLFELCVVLSRLCVVSTLLLGTTTVYSEYCDVRNCVPDLPDDGNLSVCISLGRQVVV